MSDSIDLGLASATVLGNEQKDPHTFEGPEKILEVDFVPGKGPERGLRSLERETWNSILDLARCQILSTRQNGFFDAYVLSESSLFVYEYKVFLKTCGTTTLLRCLPLLLEKAEEAGLEMEWIGYSRKNYMFPGDQVFPHCSFEQEVEYTKACHGPHGEHLMGGAYLLGDMTSDHWYVYVADYCERDCKDSLDRNVNIMMYDLDPAVREIFYKKPGVPGDEDVVRARIESGIDKLIPNAEIDDWMFEPCGYSMNGLEDDAFYTVHITPEDECCYASFETNARCGSYEKLLQDVLHVFKPKRFSVTVFADAAALKTIDTSPAQFDTVVADRKNMNVYRRVASSSTSFKTDYVCQMSNFMLCDSKKNMEEINSGLYDSVVNPIPVQVEAAVEVSVSDYSEENMAENPDEESKANVDTCVRSACYNVVPQSGAIIA